MKYAIMSDAHANPLALKTALADARSLGCEKFIFAGDITGYGYDAKTTLDLVRENSTLCFSATTILRVLGLNRHGRCR